MYVHRCNGKILIWDLRRTIKPVREIDSPNENEIPVKQINHTIWSNGSIHAGYANGNIFAFSSGIPEVESWVNYVHM